MVNKVKRRIEQFISNFNLSFSATNVDVIMHTAEDAKTLVRLLLDLMLVPTATAASVVRGFIVISIAPAGTRVVSNSTTQALDVPKPMQEIARIPVAAEIATDIGKNVIPIFRTIKSMRKMKETDTLIMSIVGSAAVTFDLIGTVLAIFKE